MTSTFKTIFTLLFFLHAFHCLGAETAPPLPWNLEALGKAPETFPAPGFNAPGVKALFYAGQPYKGNPTHVFAWYGVPEGLPPAGTKFPAMILVHGGGGTAFDEWVRLWTKRGYAALAMDTCGCVPKGTYGDWERHAMGGPAGWGGFESIDEPITDQWTYHAIADIVLAHSLLRSFPEVDPDRIGITGISWGGYLTCIAAGVDSRLRLAVPVYGCGFLGDNSTWLDVFKEMGEEKSKKWLSLWDPSVYLPRAALPILWVTGTNDFAYPMDSLQRSYRLPQGPRTLCIRIEMPHGHGGAGENPEEIHAFAEHHFNQKPALPKITSQGREGNQVWVVFESDISPLTAELCYTRDSGVWMDRAWKSESAIIHPESKKATATLPADAAVYYLNVLTPDGNVVSSEHETLN